MLDNPGLTNFRDLQGPRTPCLKKIAPTFSYASGDSESET